MFHRVKPENEKPQAQTPNRAVLSDEQKKATPISAGFSEQSPKMPSENMYSNIKPNLAPKPVNPLTTNTTATLSTSEKKENLTMNDMTDNKFSSDDNNQPKAVDIPSSVYSTQTPRPSYPGAAYANYGLQTAPAANTSFGAEERRLVIGKGISVSGEIESCDILIVEGTIEAALKGAKVLEISETGTFYGTVEINEATVAGRFEGDLTVNGRLTVSSGGIITGSIAYKELEIQAGALIEGQITPLRAGAADLKTKEKTKSPKEAAALAKAREIKAQPDQQFTSEKNEGELFAARAAAE